VKVNFSFTAFTYGDQVKRLSVSAVIAWRR